MYEAVFLEHRGVSKLKAEQTPPRLSCDWSALQNENKYSKASELSYFGWRRLSMVMARACLCAPLLPCCPCETLQVVVCTNIQKWTWNRPCHFNNCKMFSYWTEGCAKTLVMFYGLCILLWFDLDLLCFYCKTLCERWCRNKPKILTRYWSFCMENEIQKCF